MILSALFIVAVALEAFLFAGKDALPNARLRATLEEQLRKAYADVKESRKRVDAVRAKLREATEAAERRRSALYDADEAFAKSQVTMPTLVYTVGQPGAGACFRASVTKALPAAAEASQLAVWGCRNFVDVWADTIDMARALAARQFTSKQGYTLGDFVEVQPHAAEPAQKAAA